MLLIRRVEERIADHIEAGEILCPCHLYIGQEAVAVGVCAALRVDDFVFSTHRSHGHYLAKGGNVDALMSEVFCRESGCSGGWGGSMHVADAAVGLPGSSAIVAGTIPLAVGAALAFATRGEDRVAVAFFGDGATNEGVFYECLNFAALRRLPVLFVCENNLYSTHLPIDECLADTDIARKASVFGLPGEKVDGNDVLAVAAAASTAVERARTGGGPALLECMTYRWRGHVGPNYDVERGLRSQEELDCWIRRCPIKGLEDRLLREDPTTADDIAAARKDVEETVAHALAKARAARFPTGTQLLASLPDGGRP
jgi:pyruvate dehydrogenase E1 component alpha subunit